ncbi:hypothetical protein PF006_g4641 [Phytophthora fragariae]|uniref:Uncharacterized protein n=2 Tax=Phytophthora fragariae TaxID=53985 RepID=A0A6A3UJK7_9STRA|nr:hypothetical protein PF006_g4641 [Phytophthora fragariae]
MGSSDSKLSAQAQAQQEEQYALQMKNPAVAAALEALEINKPTTGFKFYQLFAAMDKDGNAFLAMCTSKANLFKPIFDLQTRARTKSLGVGFWSSAGKKRAKILSGDKDVFEVAASQLQAIRGVPSRTNILSGSPVRKLSSSSASSLSATDANPKAPEDVPAKPGLVDKTSLDAWLQAEAKKEPLVQAYVTAFSQAYVAAAHLNEQSQKASAAPGQDQLLLDLRYTVAVSTKRRDEARSALEELWEQEQSSLITERHDAVTTLVRSISTKTLHKQTGKKSADKVVKSYTQKKLDIEESNIRSRFSERWQILERAAELVAQRDLETASKNSTKSTNATTRK